MPSTEFQRGTAAVQPELWRLLDCYLSSNWKAKAVTALLRLKSASQTPVAFTEVTTAQINTVISFLLQAGEGVLVSHKGQTESKAWTWDKKNGQRVSMWQFKPGVCLLCIWNQFEMGDVRDCLKDMIALPKIRKHCSDLQTTLFLKRTQKSVNILYHWSQVCICLLSSQLSFNLLLITYRAPYTDWLILILTRAQSKRFSYVLSPANRPKPKEYSFKMI